MEANVEVDVEVNVDARVKVNMEVIVDPPSPHLNSFRTQCGLIGSFRFEVHIAEHCSRLTRD